MTAVPFDWIPSAMPEPESRAPSCAMNATSATRPHPHDAAARLLPPRAPSTIAAEHVTVVEAVDRLADRVGERGSDRDHHLDRVGARGRLPDDRPRSRRHRCSPAPERAASTTCGSACSVLPARALEPIARAGADVEVRVVDGGVDERRPGRSPPRSAGSRPTRAGAACRRSPGRCRRSRAGRARARRRGRTPCRSSAASAASTSAARSRSGMSPRVVAGRRGLHLGVA